MLVQESATQEEKSSGELVDLPSAGRAVVLVNRLRCILQLSGLPTGMLVDELAAWADRWLGVLAPLVVRIGAPAPEAPPLLTFRHERHPVCNEIRAWQPVDSVSRRDSHRGLPGELALFRGKKGFEKGDGLADVGDLLGFFIRDLHAKLILELHD